MTEVAEVLQTSESHHPKNGLESVRTSNQRVTVCSYLLDSAWNGRTICLERERGESTFSSVNLWNPERMSTPATDELPSPAASTGTRCCGVATTAAYAE